jgi:hypothetical protein
MDRTWSVVYGHLRPTFLFFSRGTLKQLGLRLRRKTYTEAFSERKLNKQH